MVFLFTACVAILVTMSFALVRAMLGPTVFDRVLSLNMFGTKTVLLICVVSFLQGRTDFLDLALLYSLMNFIGVVALLRFTTQGEFGGQNPNVDTPFGDKSIGNTALKSGGD
ncbi:Na(+)/H(+) antiporter subunit F [Rubripirellula obstinata]|uniref:Na(+)/H(+) antiporter subunit F n=1 Tax=Rubripirellula obstinata TaxID=406547 RepID=A0A5B1CI13_9BACT|nr:monovalent cation/H+ antiporter complex subunit F [Rubripirellula obstinata]KAA1259133.1 Na(+)/H(+) antiporter subunit F [Rubripirellula obstinata]